MLANQIPDQSIGLDSNLNLCDATISNLWQDLNKIKQTAKSFPIGFQVTHRDGGRYMCKATNSAGSVDHVEEIIVQGGIPFFFFWDCIRNPPD